jgi:PAS domain S-box-containing protein
MPKHDLAASGKTARVNKFEFLALFLPVAVLIVLVGMSFASLRTESRVNEIIDTDGARLHLISGFLGAEVLGSLTHLRAVAAEAVTREALDSRQPEQLRALESSFLKLAQRNPKYQQINWIDETGLEKARVMRDQADPYVVGQQELQDKSDSYDFEMARELVPGELYISRIDLNEKDGQIVIPLRPILRIATPLECSQRKRCGIIVINIEMQHLFDLVRNPDEAGLQADYLLVNQQGILLNAVVGDSQSVEEQKQSVNFAMSHPDIWTGVLESESGSMESGDGLWTWQTLSPADALNKMTRMFPQQYLTSLGELLSGDFSLTLVARRPLSVLRDIRSEIRVIVSLAIVFSLSIYALSLLLYLSGHVRVRRAEVETAYANARIASMARMKELEERFHRLVEASSIGQLVVDHDGLIEICNPAAERMLGYEAGELSGALVDSLLPAGKRVKHAGMRKQFMQESEARQMGKGRELAAVRKDGSTFPVEIGLNPYTDHGRQLILVSIIDLSARSKSQ